MKKFIKSISVFLTFLFFSLTFNVSADANKNLINIESRTIIYESSEILNKFLPKDCKDLIKIKYSIPNTDECTQIYIYPDQHKDFDFLNQEKLDNLAIFYFKFKFKSVSKTFPTDNFSYWIEIPKELCE